MALLLAGALLSVLFSCGVFTPVAIEVLGLSGFASGISLGLICAARLDWRGNIGCFTGIALGFTWLWWMQWPVNFIQTHFPLSHLMDGVVPHAVVYCTLLLFVSAAPWRMRGVWGSLVLLIGACGAALIERLSPPSFFGFAEWIRGWYFMHFATAAAFSVEIFLHLRRLKPVPGLCTVCEYDIRALTTAKCPECGTTLRTPSA